MAAPAFPGELIDVIPPGNPLINPIDGSTITEDVVGNPRADANGDRDIGALQLGLAPFLAVSGSGDEYVELSWNEPQHHDGLTILRYELEHDETGGSSPTSENIVASSTDHTISGLTNGTEYEFKIRAIYDDGSSGEENGPYSNTVTETPYGPMGTPVVDAAPGDGWAYVNWSLPDLGGRDFYIYSIQWRIEGETHFIGAQVIFDESASTTTVPGLVNGTSYEFVVKVFASGEYSYPGSATATPYGPIAAPVVTAMPGDKEVAVSWNQPDLNGNVFVNYVIQWTLATDPTIVGYQVITDYTTLSTTATGLTNGTDYVFFVTVSASPFGLSPKGSATATPLGTIGTPVVTAVPGDREVALSWTLPDLGGREFIAYTILWRVAGTASYTGATATFNPDETTITITGLKNGTTYEFAVTVNASGEISEQGLATATPVKLGTKKDTDKDGLTDDDEVNIYKTDPFNPDTDGDGLTDGDEVNTYKTDPLKPDTDGDGFADGSELIAGTDPLDPASYSTNDAMLRDEDAGWLGRSVHGITHTPPTYTDIYSDVADGAYNADWIEQIYNDGITEGCDATNTLYCPKQPVTKAQAVKLILRAANGDTYVPDPAVVPPFNDVPLTHPDVDWINQAKTDGITSGCGNGSNFCPEDVLNQKGFLKMLREAF